MSTITTQLRVCISLLLLTTLVIGEAGSEVQAQAQAQAQSTERLIVLASDAALAADAVVDVGGTVEQSFDTLGAVVGTIPAGGSAALRTRPGVLAAEPDGTGTFTSDPEIGDAFDPASDHGSLWWLGELTGAHDLWRRGLTGAGVDIALIDSGIVPVPGLDDEDRVLHGPDFSLESNLDDLRHLDTYGHGTNMAGIIAGRQGPAADADDIDAVQGIAPDARLISIKVAEQRGAADVSQIMAAIDWVIANRNRDGLDIRVLALAFATDSPQSYVIDPLSFAVEQAWRHGIVVVVAAGNGGNATSTLPMPAQNPFVIAVGATDTHANAAPADDTVASYSSRGSSSRPPDLLAPGTGIVSLRNPGSYLDDTYPAARRGETLFRGSGTSQATAVVAGLVALLIEEHPGYTPDQILYLATKSADELPGTSARLQGAGVIDIRGASTARLPWLPVLATQIHVPATGLGSLDGARGTLQLVENEVPLVGSHDIFGSTLDIGSWVVRAAAGTAFDDGEWNGNRWADDTWTGNRWAGNRWAGDGWNGNRWASGDWSAERWSTAAWG